MSKNPKVGIVILNWNTKKVTSKAVSFALRMRYDNFSLVVVDNGSIDGSVDYLKAKFSDRITIIENSKNLGYSAGFNTGINFFVDKKYDYVLVLNSDAYISPGSLSALVDTATSEKKVGFVTGKVYHYNQPKRLQIIGREKNWLTLIGKAIGTGEIDVGQYDSITELDYIDDVFMLINLEFVREEGNYDENFFIQFEEADLITRGKKKGYLVYFTPDAKVWHKVSFTTGGTDSPMRYYYSYRNRIIFLHKHQRRHLFFLFLVYNLFIHIPKSVALFITKNNSTVSLSVIQGSLSGIKFVAR